MEYQYDCRVLLGAAKRQLQQFLQKEKGTFEVKKSYNKDL